MHDACTCTWILLCTVFVDVSVWSRQVLSEIGVRTQTWRRFGLTINDSRRSHVSLITKILLLLTANFTINSIFSKTPWTQKWVTCMYAAVAGGWKRMQNATEKCDCGKHLTVECVLSCAKGGFPSIRQRNKGYYGYHNFNMCVIKWCFDNQNVNVYCWYIPQDHAPYYCTNKHVPEC
jgi:hypothetical protein